MKNQWMKIICLVALVVFVLSACQPIPVATDAVPAGAEKQTQPTGADAADPAAPSEQTNPEQKTGDDKCHPKQSIFPAVKENEWIMGAKDAKITILEYGDFM